MNLPMNEN